MLLIALAFIHFEGGWMPERLNEWSAQSGGYTIGSNFDEIAHLRTNEVHCGCDDPMHILTLMLRGTGMRWRFVDRARRVLSVVPIAQEFLEDEAP
jgi:hypothetical protein